MIFVTLALSLYQQSRVMRGIEQGMTQAELVAEPGEPRLELKQPGFCKKSPGRGIARRRALPGLEIWYRYLPRGWALLGFTGGVLWYGGCLWA